MKGLGAVAVAGLVAWTFLAPASGAWAFAVADFAFIAWLARELRRTDAAALRARARLPLQPDEADLVGRYALYFARPGFARECASTLSALGLASLVAEIFFIPFLVAASIGLILTIIGIPFVVLLVPIAIIIAVFAFLLGFTALACRLGEWVEDRLGWQPGNAFVATTIGFVILLAPTLVARFVHFGLWGGPVTFVMIGIGLTVEFLAWTMGLGAAIITGLGRWYTVPPPISVTPAGPAPFNPAPTSL